MLSSLVSCCWLLEFDDTEAAFFVFDVLYDQGPGRPAPPESPRGTQATLPGPEDRPEVLPLHAHQLDTVVINVADEHASVSVCSDTPGTDVFFHVFQLTWKWNGFLDSMGHGNEKVQSL